MGNSDAKLQTAQYATTCARKDGPLDKWAPSKAVVTAAFNFAIATGRLEDRRNEDEEETE